MIEEKPLMGFLPHWRFFFLMGEDSNISEDSHLNLQKPGRCQSAKNGDAL
jgi:hypothetical protein